MCERASFDSAIKRATASGYAVGGIGTYSEKLLHRTLKFYFEPDESKHEVEFLDYVCDVYNDEGITEIQTRNFAAIRAKLERFLEVERVTLIYPIVENKLICKIDEETGESLQPRKSNKRGVLYDALAELSMIRSVIPNDNLTVQILMLDAVETRRLRGNIRVGRKRTQKIDLIPTVLNSSVSLKSQDDYRLFVPDCLEDGFSRSEFEKATGLSSYDSHGALMLLLKLEILKREKGDKKAYKYYLN